VELNITTGHARGLPSFMAGLFGPSVAKGSGVTGG
jgi:hypothetical protein